MVIMGEGCICPDFRDIMREGIKMKISIIIIFIFVMSSCAFTSSPDETKIVSPETIKALLKVGGIGRGMTKDQVRQSWGEPKRIKKVNSKNYDEIWYYDFNWKGDNKLYFKDGIYID